MKLCISTDTVKQKVVVVMSVKQAQQLYDLFDGLMGLDSGEAPEFGDKQFDVMSKLHSLLADVPE